MKKYRYGDYVICRDKNGRLFVDEEFNNMDNLVMFKWENIWIITYYKRSGFLRIQKVPIREGVKIIFKESHACFVEKKEAFKSMIIQLQNNASGMREVIEGLSENLRIIEDNIAKLHIEKLYQGSCFDKPVK